MKLTLLPTRLRESPLLCFWFLLAGHALWCGLHQGFVPRETPDTWSYIVVMDLSYPEIFLRIRTVGYPLFLCLLRLLHPEFRALVPIVQLLLQYAALLFLWKVLRRFKLSPWQVFGACAAMAISLSGEEVGYRILASDNLACTAVLFTVSAFWLYLLSPRLSTLLGAAAGLAFSYQVRPANQFLVPLFALFGFAYFWLRRNSLAHWKRPAFALVLSTTFPLAAFVLFRGLAFGHYGLVSFDGSMLAGKAMAVMEERDVEEVLPQDLRPFGREILRRRKKLNLPEVFHGNKVTRWAYYATDAAMVHDIAGKLWFENCLSSGGVCTDHAANSYLKRFAMPILKARPWRLIQLTIANFIETVLRLFRGSLFLDALLLLKLLEWARYLFRGRRPADHPERETPFVLTALTWGVLGLGAIQIIVVCVPAQRYLDAVTLLIPALFGIHAGAAFRRIAQGRRWADFNLRPTQEALPSCT